MKILIRISALFFIFTFLSCNFNSANENLNTIECPDEIKQRAFDFAKLYRDSDTVYEYGGQDAVRSIKIDCSGLVVMCYKYAIVDTNYSLCFDDSTAYNLFEKYSVQTSTSEQGDLIFMGESGTDKITHIAIFDRNENGTVYFIDSTPFDDVNGVTERSYLETNDKFKSYGIMKLKQ